MRILRTYPANKIQNSFRRDVRLKVVGIDGFLWRAVDVNPLIDYVDTSKISGLTSPARRALRHSRAKLMGGAHGDTALC